MIIEILTCSFAGFSYSRLEGLEGTLSEEIAQPTVYCRLSQLSVDIQLYGLISWSPLKMPIKEHVEYEGKSSQE